MKIKRTEVEFQIVEDTREQKPLSFKRESVRKKLDTGDYSIVGYEHTVCCERKSISDLIGTCDQKERQRFKRELVRMQKGFQFYAIVIAGYEEDVLSHCVDIHKIQCKQYAEKIKKWKGIRKPMLPEVRAKGVLGSLRSWRTKFNTHYYFLGSEMGVAEWVETQF